MISPPGSECSPQVCQALNAVTQRNAVSALVDARTAPRPGQVELRGPRLPSGSHCTSWPPATKLRQHLSPQDAVLAGEGPAGLVLSQRAELE